MCRVAAGGAHPGDGQDGDPARGRDGAHHLLPGHLRCAKRRKHVIDVLACLAAQGLPAAMLGTFQARQGSSSFLPAALMQGVSCS